MPILNYTTQVPMEKTVGVIQGLLVRKGVSSISTELANGKVAAINFSIDLHGHRVDFRLPCNVPGVEQALWNDRTVEHKYKSREHAERVAWRIVKDWVEVQLAFVESNQAQIAEVFMPYAVFNGKTMFQAFQLQVERGLLTAGNPPAEEATA